MTGFLVRGGVYMLVLLSMSWLMDKDMLSNIFTKPIREMVRK